ncbi:ATP-binding cassette domain-containing protein [Aurantibacillus circumpalustris]|uniref:ATP-binding cassette domain-containing protein n=1 Tax=Aurantibacillus circumpalustris TaxID=3036359 RepID=UPI00295C1ADD|nr:ATP-binding cassette domain-containing protein [Aurantibacillus circumpalustris]
MSEEILKALMQLFAIIAKQDGVLLDDHEKFVGDFLSSQLSIDRVSEYMVLYNDFLGDVKTESPSADAKDKARTSMKDSVRTLAICKKINKTLAQKQKTIVLIRLLEFFKNDSQKSTNRVQIVETVADVFKIEKQEFLDIKNFVFEPKDETNENEIVIGEEEFKNSCNCKHYLPFQNYSGNCKFIYIQSINIVILKYHGNVELFLNGVVIKPENIYLFPHGSTLRLPQTTIYYSNIISKFTEDLSGEAFSFDAHIIEHKFPNGKKALNELKIAETSANLVGIMGASGSGKTTLLTLLSGQDKPSNGKIEINGVDLNSGSNDLKGAIGFVPQDDLLIEDLTVYENLFYNAKLCFKDLNEEELNQKISKTLISLGLEEIKGIKVGSPLNKKISGGQRKRLNIALELIREPHVLFLDEPTSGLSSRDSENVMDLLKELTFRGKLIFVVIHQPSSDIFKMFDKILILDTGGYPSYYGNPIEGVMYFKKVTNQINSEVGECYACGSVNPETIFNLIELKEIDEYGNYTAKRKIEPLKFYEYYKEKFLSKIEVKPVLTKLQSTFSVPNRFVQTKYFFLRDLFSKLSNKQYILINLIEVPVLVMFLSLIIRFIDKTKSEGYTYFHNTNIPSYFFMSIIVALLVGLTISAEEIYKDQKILKREKFLHLSRLSYLSSKVILLFAISAIQSILFVIIGNVILQIYVNYFSFFFVLFSVFCFSNILGLILSSTFNSPVTIYIIIPLIIIPQLILGGAMFSYSKLSSLFGGGHKVPGIANVMVSRWAYEALAVDMYVNTPYNKERFIYSKLESKFNYKLVYLIPKLEEIVKERSKELKENFDQRTQLIKSELEKDLVESSKLGYKNKLPDFINNESVLNYLQALNVFYSEMFNHASEIKEIANAKQIAELGGESEFEKLKLKYFNNSLDEIVTGSLEKEKIVIENNSLVQIVDPIFQEPSSENTFVGTKTHFLSASKYLFNSLVPTYYFNLFVIWFINVLLFLILYFDVFKRIFNKLN